MEKYDQTFCETTKGGRKWNDTPQPCCICGEMTHASCLGAPVCGMECENNAFNQGKIGV